MTNETLEVFDKMLKSILKSQVLQKYIHQNLKIKHILFDLASCITCYKYEHGLCFPWIKKKKFQLHDSIKHIIDDK